MTELESTIHSRGANQHWLMWVVLELYLYLLHFLWVALEASPLLDIAGILQVIVVLEGTSQQV